MQPNAPQQAPSPDEEMPDAPAPDGMEPQGDDVAEGPSPNDPDEDVAQKLWHRIDGLRQQDIDAFMTNLPRPVGLILLKIVPELSALILETPEMQGDDMADVRADFDHDEVMNHIGQHLGVGQAPGGAPQDGAPGGQPQGGAPQASPPHQTGAPPPPALPMPQAQPMQQGQEPPQKKRGFLHQV